MEDVHMGVDEPGQDRPVADIDHPHAGRQLHLVSLAHGGDAPIVDDQDGVLHHWRS
jgi:hypothetical protein